MSVKTKWLIARLKAMSFPEILWRIKNKVKSNLFHIAYILRLFNKYYRIKLSDNKENILGEKIFSENHRNSYPFDVSSMSKAAENILNHKLDLFELNDIYLGDTIDWHLDYKTGRRWPKKFALSLDWRNTEIGGVKYVWEINRHQFIVPLAKAFFLTKDPKYGEECLKILSDWVDQNKPIEGINWTSHLEIAIRLISWTFALHFLWDMLDFTDTALKKIIKSLVIQACFIENNLSKYSSANNHRLGEVAGLAIIGLGFPGIPDFERLAKKGIKLLEEEIFKQIYDDGVGKEQSNGYLCFILDLALAGLAFARFRNYPINIKVWQRIEAACNYLVTISENSATIPQIGDEDDAFAIRFDTSCDNSRGVVGNVGVLLNRQNLIRWANPLNEKVYWLAGPYTPAENNLKKEQEKMPRSTAFEKGGYYLMKSRMCNQDVSTQIDCGEIGYLSIAAHGHADSLSFILRHGSEFIFIDPGTYLYQSGERWREYFKGTTAHNTIRVDDKEQSESAGTFLWGMKAQSYPELWATTDKVDVFIGSHDGYKRLKDPVLHRRALIFIKPNIFLLIDRISAKSVHQYEQLFHLHPNIQAEKISNNHWFLNGENTSCCLLFWPSDGHKITSIRGRSNPILGWYSPAFGVKQPSTTILNFFSNKGNTNLVSIIGVQEDSMDLTTSVTESLISIEIKLKMKKYSLLLSKDLSTPIHQFNKSLSEKCIGYIKSDCGTSFEISKRLGLKPSVI